MRAALGCRRAPRAAFFGLLLGAALLTACGSTAPAAARTTTTKAGPPAPVPALGVKYGALLGQVPNDFLKFSNAVAGDHDPDGDLLYRQAAPAMSALRNLDTALAAGSAPSRIAHDIALLVLDDERLLQDMQGLPGLAGAALTSWEQAFEADGKTEQTAYNDVLYDFGLPSVSAG